MEEEITRLRLPERGEVFGIVEELLGGDRLRVKCNDNLVRICRIPGKIRKRVWIRSGDVVLIAPWKVQSDTRGDVVWRYSAAQVDGLRRQGHIKR